MSAGQVPNLNTLRRGGGGRGGASARRGPPREPRESDINPLLPTRFANDGFRIPRAPSSHDPDIAIQGTDLEAARSRLEIHRLGYVTDDFVEWFTKAGRQPTASSQIPRTEKNRGTFLRTWVVDHLIEKFLQPTASETSAFRQHGSPIRRQIVSLGAGTDTRYFRLLQKQNRTKQPSTAKPTNDRRAPENEASVELVYHEIDLPENARQKATCLNKPEFREHVRALTSIDFYNDQQPLASSNPASFHSPTGYHLHPFDLRDLSLNPNKPDTTPTPSDPSAATTTPQFQGLDPEIPTLLLSELCLMYLPAPAAEAALTYFLTTVFPTTTPTPTPLGLLILEPILPSDAFGRQMLASMAEQNIHFGTIRRFPQLTDQKWRLEEALGLRAGADEARRKTGRAGAVDWWTLWREWLGEEERRAAEAREPLEEIEYWRDLFRHYCLAWGYRAGDGDADGDDERGGEGQGKGQSPFEGWFSADGQ